MVGCWALLFARMPGLVDAADPDRSGKPATKTEDRILEIQKLLESPVEMKGFPEPVPLEKFLATLEALLPEGKRVSFRIDEEAFGKQLPKVAGATVKCPRVKNVSLVSVLRRALSQVSEIDEVDFAIRPGGVVITRPRLAAHRVVYDVRGFVRQVPQLLRDLAEESPELYRDLKPDDGPGMLVRFLSNGVALRPWETIEILNGTRLAVFASPTRHEEIDDLLSVLRRRADVAVIMNARLYEVDRAFFAKHVAPLFARDKDSDERPQVIPIEGPLFKKIIQEKLLLESEDEKLRPRQKAPFLSRQEVFRFAAGPHPTKAGEAVTGTGTAGVSFEVQPVLSYDLRYLRLHVSQEVAQLVGIDKVKTLDVASGKEVEVESPNLRKTTVTGTVQIPDGGAILMPVAYRPPGKDNADKVWLLVARPFIWIEEEVRFIRKEGGDVTPRSVWDSEVPKDEQKPTPAKPLPFNDEVKEVLQAVITDVLTNPDLKDTREFYGTAKDNTVTLVDNEKLGWPKEFKPDAHGYKLVEVRPDPFANRRRILGIRLDRFELKPGKSGPHDESIQVCVFNAGGDANGGVIGSCTVYYGLKRVGKHWAVEYAGLLDP
jgi:hypothetical protein